MTSSFFDEKRAAAILKHGILRRYLALYASKTGIKSANHRVVFLDGYAGPGVYADGKPGSPALAVQTAQALAASRNLEGIYVEEDKATATQLREFLATTPQKWTVLEGSIEDRLDEALALAGDSPLFAFFDPFGLGVSMSDLKKVFARSKKTFMGRGGPPTEVLLNFSYPGLRRPAGHLTATGTDEKYLKARKKILENLDATLGGEWWRALVIDKDEKWVARVAANYVDRLGDAVHAGWYRLPVRNRLDGAVVYDLMFLTQYARQGLWHFAESVSCAREEYVGYFESAENQAELDLEPPDAQAKTWSAEIADNLRKRLAKGGFVVGDELSAVYGKVLGFARAKHVRAAIKDLYSRGETDHNGVGNDVAEFRLGKGTGTPPPPKPKPKKR